jgi:ABC-type nitrate/sulfonate/bicarbonate transport system ATPase subunit
MLQLAGVRKAYAPRGRAAGDAVVALDRISLEAQPGSFITIIGPSGCGKSTLLACIAGLVHYDDGEIHVSAHLVHGPFPECAVVFQQASLLPWRSVLRNVEYGLELAGVGKAERRARAREALSVVGLGHHEGYLPHELSGGMQQRVNLARALATEPELLLMDEPFGALDALTKERLQDELASLSALSGRTTLFITHDVEEAVFLGDRVVVMSAAPGRIIQTLDVPLERPRSRADLASGEIQRLILELRSMLAAPGAVADVAA